MRKILRITNVRGNSQAAQIGMEIGDILLSYNGVPLSSNAGLSNATFAADEKNVSERAVAFERNGIRREAAVVPGTLGIQCSEEADHAVGVTLSKAQEVPYTSQYSVGRAVASVIGVFGWALVVLGGISAVMAAANNGSTGMGAMSFVRVMPGLGALVGGFLLIMGAQVTKATIDNADHTREILKTLERGN